MAEPECQPRAGRLQSLMQTFFFLWEDTLPSTGSRFLIIFGQKISDLVFLDGAEVSQRQLSAQWVLVYSSIESLFQHPSLQGPSSASLYLEAI